MNKIAAETRVSLNSGSITRGLSTGSYDNVDNARGNSIQKTDSANVSQRKIPIYLRASAGSCHDICKYGRGHAFAEDKPKIPLRKRIAKKSSSNEDTFIEIFVAGEQKKENVDAKKHSLKPSPRPNALSSGKTRSTNSTTKKPPSPETPETVLREISLPQDSIDDQKTFDQHPSSVKAKTVKVKSSDGVQTGVKVRASASAPAKKSAAPKSSLSMTASNKARQSGSVKSSFPGKDQRRVEIGTESNPLESAPENQSLSQENPSMADELASDNKNFPMESEKIVLESTLDSHITPALPFPPSSKSSSHRRSPSSSSMPSSHRRSPSSSSMPLSHRRSPSSTSMPLSHRRSPSSSSMPLSHRRSPSSASVPSSHKRSPSTSSMSSSHRRSPLSSSNFSSHRRSPSSSSKSSYHSRSPSMTSLEVDEEIKNIGNETDKLISGRKTPVKITPPKVNSLNKNLKNSGDKHCEPVKLKFRSGKVMELQQDNKNNNIPRRLKFRKMRIDGIKAEISASHRRKSLEIGSIQLKRNTLRKTRVFVPEYKRRSPKMQFGTDNNMPLRLRFRRGRIIGADDGKGDSKWKKDVQCLFNNVIEETATKLVESRKSKVKALVGAFESVISLQEHK